MLELNNVEVLYSDVILAVKGITVQVPVGRCVTLLGANGAGKSTTLKAISNLVRTEDGRVSAGTIRSKSSARTRRRTTTSGRMSAGRRSTWASSSEGRSR